MECRRSGWITRGLYADDILLRVRGERSLRLIQYYKHVAERVTYTGASPDRDIERRFHCLSARCQKFSKCRVHVINQNISLWTNTKMNYQFCIGFRQREAGGIRVPPDEGMAEPIPIKGYGFVKIAHMQ